MDSEWTKFLSTVVEGGNRTLRDTGNEGREYGIKPGSYADND